jgi:hypothetical protein
MMVMQVSSGDGTRIVVVVAFHHCGNFGAEVTPAFPLCLYGIKIIEKEEER